MQGATNELTMKAEFAIPATGWLFATALGVLVLATVALSIVNGPQIRAAAEAALEQENRAVCTKLGIGPETTRYADCAAALSSVRTSYAHRNEQSIL